MNYPCSATIAERAYDGGNRGRPEPTDAEITQGQDRAIAKLIAVKIGSPTEDGRDLVSEAIGQDDGLLKLIANYIHANAYTGEPMDEAYVGRRVLGVVRDYLVSVAEHRGML